MTNALDMKVLELMTAGGHEEVVFFNDPDAGLRAIVAIHSTALGPGLGGTRFFPYDDEADALADVLRLSRAMTYKAACAGLDLGGGKAVIVGDPRTLKSERLLRMYGRYLDSLGGRYITAEDVGTSLEDMERIREETRWVAGTSLASGGSGDPSPMTAIGVLEGIKASCRWAFGDPSLEDRSVAVQGVGKVGGALCRHLRDEGARVVISDIDETAVKQIVEDLGVETADPDQIHRIEADVFSPCALGGTINDATIGELRCAIVAGAANNQLQREELGDELAGRGIVYAPDFVINAGGIVNIAEELGTYDEVAAESKVRRIFDRLLEVFVRAQARGTSTWRAAMDVAEERIERARRPAREAGGPDGG